MTIVATPDRESVRAAALSPEVIECRRELASFTAKTFLEAGKELHFMGHFLGDDRREGRSPFGHGDDAVVAISMLLRIASQLSSAASDLILSGRHYAGSALVRQLVEVEYLAWAFEADNDEAAKWPRSSHQERRDFFTPAKLRQAAGTRFRSYDYGQHCELGGHPTPQSWQLLNEDVAMAQLMLSDCLGHCGRVWDHLVGWAGSHRLGHSILSRAADMSARYMAWKELDLLTGLPPPPQH